MFDLTGLTGGLPVSGNQSTIVLKGREHSGQTHLRVKLPSPLPSVREMMGRAWLPQCGQADRHSQTVGRAVQSIRSLMGHARTVSGGRESEVGNYAPHPSRKDPRADRFPGKDRPKS